jgi:butyryl-CoA dehydrogenase
MSNLPDPRELAFQLYDVLDAETLTRRGRFAEHSRETFDAALETARRIAETQFAPHYAKADREEPRFDGERVHLPAEIGQAVRAFAEAGFMAAHQDAELGGMQLPWTVTQACFALFQAANISTSAYPFLTIAAANLLQAHGSQEQVGLYLQPMLEGRFLGTMALSEPQAGSSLADIRTRAVPQSDGSFHIVGDKMWISGGDNELAENIVHMVLARIEGAPAGVKGISLFRVPKFPVRPDGALGPRNEVRLAGLNHKMGYRGTVNTVLKFGEKGPCHGWLIGEPHQGLAYMFYMMNEARIGVGLGAAMLGYAGYQASLQYARERLQGRSPGAKDPAAPQVPLIAHTDVRRMLLMQKAWCEGALALCLYAARLVDEQKTGESEAARRDAGLLLDALTPIVKAWPSEWCLEANKWAIQILGGYGYTRDFPVEQLYRDNRLNMIHEGTNGIQAIDLLGRKARSEGFALLLAGIERDAAAAPAALSEFRDALRAAAATLARVTETLLGERDAGRMLANASAHLQLAGTVVIAWMLLRQASAAAKLPQDDFTAGKRAACQWFFRWDLPQVDVLARRLEAFDDTALATKVDWL